MSVQHHLLKGDKFLKQNAADLSGIKFLFDNVLKWILSFNLW